MTPQSPGGAITAALQGQQLSMSSIPANMRGRYNELVQLHGPEMAAIMVQQEQAGRAGVNEALQTFQKLGEVEDPRVQFARMAQMSQI